MSGLEILAIVIGLAALGILLKYAYSLNQKNQKIQAKVASLEDENARLWTTQSELSSEAKRLQAEVDQLTAENIDLKQKFDISKRADELRSNCQTLETQCSELEKRRIHSIQATSELGTQRQDLEAEIVRIRANLEYWQKQNDEIEERHTELLDRDYRLGAYPELIQLQRDLTQRIDDLEQEKTDLIEQLSQVKAQIERDLQGLHRIKIVSACRQHSTSDQELFHAKLTLDFNRVREALDFAETMFGDVLEVWDSARASADASNFIRPDDAYRALQSLAWFGQAYFERNGELGNTHYHVLMADYNLECTPEAKTVENDRRLRDERCFWHGSQRREMFDHIKLGGGNGMNKILRIYFNINRESQRIEIGHCGKHLSN